MPILSNFPQPAEMTTNKVTAVTNESTDEQYPSARAVYEAIPKAGIDCAYPILKGTAAPTASTAGAVGQHYLNTGTGKEYVCTAVSGNSYTWKLVNPDTPEEVGAAAASHSHAAGDLPSASTSQKGVVQLNSSTSSTSTTQAATPSAVRSAYNLANGKASVTSGSATCPASDSWSGPTDGLYTVTVAISGFTASTRVHITPVISTTDTDTGDAQQEAWDTHYTAETVSGGIKFYAKELPTVAVPFTWEVVA